MNSVKTALITSILALAFSGCATTPHSDLIYVGTSIKFPAPYPGMKPFTYPGLILSHFGDSQIFTSGPTELQECKGESCATGIAKSKATVRVSKFESGKFAVHLSVDIDIGQHQTIRSETVTSLQETRASLPDGSNIIYDHIKVERDLLIAPNEIKEIPLAHALSAYVCVSPPMEKQTVPSGCNFNEIRP